MSCVVCMDCCVGDCWNVGSGQKEEGGLFSKKCGNNVNQCKVLDRRKGVGLHYHALYLCACVNI